MLAGKLSMLLGYGRYFGGGSRGRKVGKLIGLPLTDLFEGGGAHVLGVSRGGWFDGEGCRFGEWAGREKGSRCWKEVQAQARKGKSLQVDWERRGYWKCANASPSVSVHG